MLKLKFVPDRNQTELLTDIQQRVKMALRDAMIKPLNHQA